MLEATAKTVATATTYTIPGNTILIDDGTSPALIRPTAVVVTETDGALQGFSFAGPRQLGSPATGTHDSDGRDMGARMIQINELDLGDATEELINEVMGLHLRNTVKVLNEAETREIMSKIA